MRRAPYACSHPASRSLRPSAVRGGGGKLSCVRGRVVPCLLLFAGVRAAPLAAQADASLGLGVGTVRYPGGTSFSTAAVSPAVRYTAASLFADAAGSFASLPGGAWSGQGQADVWIATPPLARHLRLGVEGLVAGTSRTDGGPTGAAHGLGELLWSAPRWGVGVGAGPSGGWISGASSVAAFHGRARLWWQAGGASWEVSVQPTRFLGAWFTDATASVTLDRGWGAFSAWGAARLSGTYGSKAAGSLLLQVFPVSTVSLEVGGGSYLPDPYQGLPRAGYVTLGVRLHAVARSVRRAPPAAAWPPVVAAARGDSAVVRFRFAEARSVAVAGDWNGWRPDPLHPVGPGVWEAVLALRPGLYHFNLLVDGAEWVVPNGVATVSDGLGGMVAVLVVP